MWGGTKAVDRLAIRFGNDQPPTPFEICPAPKTHAIWQLWEFRWKPKTPGTSTITMSVPDASVPQRRLTSGYYMRQVTITDI